MTDRSDKAGRRWLELIALASIAAGSAGATSASAAHAAVEPQQVENRVLAIRDRLAELAAQSQREPVLEDAVDAPGPLAQWYNWPNWRNGWGNWGNWRNW